MLKDTSTGLIGNDRFEGFGIDVINELSALYGFEYEFVLQDDKYYGSCIDKDTNTWNGMIGKVMSGVCKIPLYATCKIVPPYQLKLLSPLTQEADLAITDLTINSDRITALDFTPSFMNLGIFHPHPFYQKILFHNTKQFDHCRYCPVVQETITRATIYFFLHVAVFIGRLDLFGCCLHYRLPMLLLLGSYITVTMGKSVSVRRRANISGKPIYAQQFHVVCSRCNPSTRLRN